MRAHYFQHVPFEGLGSIESWLKASGYDITTTQFFKSAELPNLRSIGLLIIMGGPMSIQDEEEFPWLVPEKKFIHKAIISGKPVLGICLGAQLIAHVLGAKTYLNPVKEIGWFPIYGNPAYNNSIFNFPPSTKVFHWHSETFDLPSGAIPLAKSAGCKNQAFQFGKSVIGLQFHLETTPQSAREIISHNREELIPSKYVQTEDEILSVSPESYQSINRLMRGVLSFLLKNDGDYQYRIG